MMIVIVQHRIDGIQEKVRDVERFQEDAHYLYLHFKKNSKVKQRKYVRRNVKLNCIVDREANIPRVEEQLEYSKAIIKGLLDNSDEYAKQRAMDFLEEKE